jgi:hypothetical protein
MFDTNLQVNINFIAAKASPPERSGIYLCIVPPQNDVSAHREPGHHWYLAVLEYSAKYRGFNLFDEMNPQDVAKNKIDVAFWADYDAEISEKLKEVK